MRKAVLDIVALGGLGSVIYGVHLVYPPAAFIAGGLLAFVFALAATAAGSRK